MGPRRGRTTVQSTGGSFAPGGTGKGASAAQDRLNQVRTRPFIHTVSIPVGEDSALLKKRLDAVNKRLKKIGVPPLKVTPEPGLDDAGTAVTNYRITGAVPSGHGAAGETPVLLVEWPKNAEVPTISVHPGMNPEDEPLRLGSTYEASLGAKRTPDGRLHCDECGTNRNRNQVVVLRDANGELAQVGGECAKPYMAGSWANTVGLSNEIDALRGNDGGYAYDAPPVPVRVAVAQGLALSRMVDQREEESGVWGKQLWDHEKGGYADDLAMSPEREAYENLDVDSPDVDRVLEHMQATVPDSNSDGLRRWQQRIVLLAGAENAAGKRQIADIFGAVRGAEAARKRAEREAERDAQRKAAAGSKHVGVIGERSDLTASGPATVTRVNFGYTRYYGGVKKDTYFVTFRTADGDMISWRTEKTRGLDEGDEVFITARVAEHKPPDLHSDHPVTTVKRPTLRDPDGNTI